MNYLLFMNKYELARENIITNTQATFFISL